MAEGAPLLREYGVKSPIEGSNPSLSARYGKTRLARVFPYLAERELWFEPKEPGQSMTFLTG